MNPKTIAFSLLLLLLPIALKDSPPLWYVVITLFVFLYDFKDIVYNLQHRFIRKPTITARVIGMIGIVCLALISMFLYFPLPVVAIIIIADRLIFSTVALSILITAIPIFFAKRILLYMATKKRDSFKNLIVIGVTGSYGKSSTKDLIADFLSEKYKVLKTAKTNNTEIAIARLILKDVSEKTDVLVVEIGAYRRGHVAEVCVMVKPTIGVLTGINEQHLALFGSIENTKKAKMELMDSLPESGMAFFNGDDPIALELSKQSSVKETYLYRAEDISFERSEKFSMRSNNTMLPFLSNVAAAAILAQKLGVDKKKITQKLANTIESLGIPTTTKGELTILDDSHNTNPRGFVAALDVLTTYQERKILITPGIIELGNQSERIHEELGEKIGTICEYVILVNDNFEEPIREGLARTKFNMDNLLIPKREELVLVVKSLIKGKTAILLEGRVPSQVRQIFNF